MVDFLEGRPGPLEVDSSLCGGAAHSIALLPILAGNFLLGNILLLGGEQVR